jgi:hypothetical protein
MATTAEHSETDAGPIRRGWRAQLVWMLSAGVLGFSQAGLFSGLLQIPRSWFLVPYVIITGTFLFAYVRWNGISLAYHLRHRWVWGVVGAVLVGAFLVVNVLGQPASSGPRGLGLIISLLWLGVVYGVVDALLLNVLPVVAIWSACKTLGFTDRWYGRILSGAAALMASLFVTAAYHLGYAEYRGPELVSPLIGNGIMTLGYLLTFNPLTAIGAHVALHVSSVLHGIDTTVTLPPHY